MARLQITTPDPLPDEPAADAARARKDTLDHILFFGPPGLGKTTLAMLMAREMGVQLRTSSGPVLEKPGDLVGLLTGLGRGDMLFIDEIHRLRPALEEYLYPAMEDYRVDVRIAEGPNAQTIPMTLERVTLIGATTRFGPDSASSNGWASIRRTTCAPSLPARRASSRCRSTKPEPSRSRGGAG